MGLLKEILENIRFNEKENWIQKVKVKHHIEGIWGKDVPAEKAAKEVCKIEKSLKKAVAATNFFFARGGICHKGSKHYDPEWCKKRDKMIEILHKICPKEEEK